MANSDTYWPTLKEAIADVRNSYGVKGQIKLNAEGEWQGNAPDDLELGSVSGMEVYIQRLEIETTRKGLCHALKHIPHR